MELIENHRANEIQSLFINTYSRARTNAIKASPQDRHHKQSATKIAKK